MRRRSSSRRRGDPATPARSAHQSNPPRSGVLHAVAWRSLRRAAALTPRRCACWCLSSHLFFLQPITRSRKWRRSRPTSGGCRRTKRTLQHAAHPTRRYAAPPRARAASAVCVQWIFKCESSQVCSATPARVAHTTCAHVHRGGWVSEADHRALRGRAHAPHTLRAGPRYSARAYAGATTRLAGWYARSTNRTGTQMCL